MRCACEYLSIAQRIRNQTRVSAVRQMGPKEERRVPRHASDGLRDQMACRGKPGRVRTGRGNAYLPSSACAGQAGRSGGRQRARRRCRRRSRCTSRGRCRSCRERSGQPCRSRANSKPAGVFAEAATLATTNAAGHVNLAGGLGEREEVGTVARGAVLAKHLAAEVVEGSLEVAEGDALVHDEALDLVELREMARVGCVGTEDGAWAASCRWAAPGPPSCEPGRRRSACAGGCQTRRWHGPRSRSRLPGLSSST